MKSLWISSGIVAALFLAACDSKETKAREAEHKSADAGREAGEKVRDAERKMQEKTRENVKEFKEEVRDAYVKAKNQELDELDAKIKALRAKGDNVSAEAKEAWNKAADELKRKREYVNDKLKDVKNATADTWEATTRGIDSAIADARAAFERAGAAVR